MFKRMAMLFIFKKHLMYLYNFQDILCLAIKLPIKSHHFIVSKTRICVILLSYMRIKRKYS